MNDRIVVNVPTAPAAVGPYSQAIKSGGFIFLSGQIPLDPKSGEVVGADATAQTEQVIKNIAALLEATGSGLYQIVKTTVFLKNMDDFNAMNQVYSRYFSFEPPARSTIEVARLPKDVLVEIECTVHCAKLETSPTQPF